MRAVIAARGLLSPVHMMTKFQLTLLSSSLLFTACTLDRQATSGETRDALSAPGGDQCAMITPADLDDLHSALDGGLALAELDVAANGPDLTASEGARDSFAAAVAELDDFETWMTVEGDNDPDTLSDIESAVAGQVMWNMSDKIQQAIHWGTVSAINNQSYDARDAVEAAFLAAELAQAIEVHGKRCYIGIFLP